MPTESTERKVLTTAEAGEILSVSDETIKRYFANGRLKGFKLPGGYYRIFRSSVDELMNGHPEVPDCTHEFALVDGVGVCRLCGFQP
jgi:excisionase family DNA binding protein